MDLACRRLFVLCSEIMLFMIVVSDMKSTEVDPVPELKSFGVALRLSHTGLEGAKLLPPCPVGTLNLVTQHQLEKAVLS